MNLCLTDGPMRSGCTLAHCGSGFGGRHRDCFALPLRPSVRHQTIVQRRCRLTGFPPVFKTFCTAFPYASDFITPVKNRCISLTDIHCRICQSLLTLCPEVGASSLGQKGKRQLRRSGNAKHRTSLRQTSVLLVPNLRTFAQRSPMFLNSGNVQYICPSAFRQTARLYLPSA